jgi:hypothetical protein
MGGGWPVARPVATQNSTRTRTHIHASSGIRTHEPSVREASDRAANVIGQMLLQY